MCKQRRDTRGVASPADSLISDFQPPGLWENAFLQSKPPAVVLCYQRSAPGPTFILGDRRPAVNVNRLCAIGFVL